MCLQFNRFDESMTGDRGIELKIIIYIECIKITHKHHEKYENFFFKYTYTLKNIFNIYYFSILSICWTHVPKIRMWL